MEIKQTRTYKITYYSNEMSDIDILEIECNLQRAKEGDYSFDIDFLCKELMNFTEDDGYYTEIHITSHMGNIIRYYTEKQAVGKIDVDSFCRHTDFINGLRSWLWQCHDNEPLDFKSAELRHEALLDELDNIVEKYCKKYGFDYDI